MNKTHEEFMEEVEEASREPSIAEETHDVLSEDANVSDNEVKE